MPDNKFVQNDDILRQISGQLRTCLLNIYNALDNLAPPDLRKENSKTDLNAALLTQSCYRIMRIADNLEDAAALEQPGSIKKEDADFVQLCRKLTDDAQKPAELLGLKLVFRCAEDHCYIAMDARRMERLVMNLLSNAFKFTPRGGTVTVEVRVEKARVLLLVSDTGCGIDEEMPETVFERWQQSGRMEPPPHGLGYGLRICRRVAEEHGGTIVPLKSETGGTKMAVSLPRLKVGGMRERGIAIKSGINRTLVELADALPKEAFTREFMG